MKTAEWRRAAIPCLMSLLFGGMAALWLGGAHATYLAILKFSGIEPFAGFPFLDLHAVLSAMECHRQGIDVLSSNPCDALGRRHAYSPLWLDFSWTGLGVADGAWLGTGLDLVFILSLGWVFRPRGLGEFTVFALASCSTMVVYALERANNDLIIFLALFLAAILYRKAFAARLGGYALILLSGFLKYYPLILLILIARERFWRALLIGAACVFAAALFLLAYGSSMGTALALVPRYKTYFAMDGFSAQFLPFGVGKLLSSVWGGSAIMVAIAALTCLVFVFAYVSFRSRSLAPAHDIGPEVVFFRMSCLVIVACFFAGQNINYRGIFFLPVIAGLISTRRASGDSAGRLWLTWLIAAILFLMWDEFFRLRIEEIARASTSDGPTLQNIDIAAWLLRELVWWWVIASLGAFLIAGIRRMPFTLWLAAVRPLGWYKNRAP